MMQIQGAEADKAYDKYLQYSQAHRWEFGNEILYNCCRQYPRHTDEHEIVGKLWLIGRAYAAAIERRKEKTTSPQKFMYPDFYYDNVASVMLGAGNKIDDCIQRIHHGGARGDVLAAHKMLTDIFHGLTGLEKRSLASKYLHFHCPDYVYIYDSRADAAVKKLVKGSTTVLEGATMDKIYAQFYERAQEVVRYIQDKYKKKLTPRQLDDLLLYCV